MKANKNQALSTHEIRKLLTSANVDYEATVNKALNAYLSKIFLVCPFTNQPCISKKQCIGCESSAIKITC